MNMVLKSADLIVVNGKPVFTFEGLPGINPRILHGQQVFIDGNLYDVISVETYALLEPIGHPFGTYGETSMRIFCWFNWHRDVEWVFDYWHGEYVRHCHVCGRNSVLSKVTRFLPWNR